MASYQNQISSFQGSDSSLRIIYWNAGGLNDVKFLQFKRNVYHVDADIYFIVEAGVASETPEYYQTSGYAVTVLKRSRQIASGIIIGIRSSLTAKCTILHQMEADDTLEVVMIDTWKNRQHFKIFNLYNPPGNLPSYNVIERNIHSNSIIIGDFNSPSLRWNYTRSTPAGRCLEEMIDTNVLDVINTPPTFLSYSGQLSRPDLVITHPHISDKTKVSLLDDAGGCGHRALLATISTTKFSHKDNRAPRWNFKKADWKQYRNLTDTALKMSIITESPETTISALNSIILNCARKCIPRGQIKKFKPFWNATLSSLKKTRDQSRRKAEKTQSKADLIALKKNQAMLRREIKSSKRSSFQNFISRLDFRKDGTNAHRYISRLNNDNTQKVQHPLQSGTKSLSDPRDIANAMCKHYANISRIKGDKAVARTLLRQPKTSCLDRKTTELFATDFTIHELENALSSTKLKKQAGTDGIFPELLTNLGDIAKETLLAVVNLTWQKHIPHQWRKAEIVPILKNGKDPCLAESYRPISLTSACCKVAEKMVVNRLNQYIETHGIIDNAQAGFRRHRSTMDHVVNFTQQVKDGYHRKMSTLAVLIDLKAAYDTVWRPMLIHKLAMSNISGRLFSWIKSFLSQRLIRVRHNNCSSKFRIQKQGLAQGAVLSCSLFNLMINDILDAVREVQGIQALLYADDLLIWATSGNINALEKCLNDALKKLEVWTKRNAMTVNAAKTTFQLFTLSTKVPTVSLYYKGLALEESNISKYLGVSLDRRLTWKPHVEQCAEKGLKRTRLLKRLTSTKWGANQNVLITAYKSYIRPVLDYGSEVTVTSSSATANKLDLVQNIALRVITGAAKSTPIAAMEAQTQIEPLQVLREKSAIRFWERCRRVYKPQWDVYSQASNRLKTQITPLTSYKNLYSKYGITPADAAPLCTYRDFYHHLPQATYKLNNHHLPKHISIETEMRQAALQTIHDNYPEGEWLHIYTDGSSIPGTGETGAAYYCQRFQGYLAVGAPQSSYDGEIAAIQGAAKELGKVLPPSKAVFLVDSQTAIQNLSRNTPTDCKRTVECRKSLDLLGTQGWTLKFQWIPSHVNIYGNEMADRLAKMGTSLPQPPSTVSLESTKAQICSAVHKWTHQRLKESAGGKKWESLVTHPIDQRLPRAISVAAFRMKTGHDFLGSHLHRIRVLPSPQCLLCGYETMDADHLKSCPSLDHSQDEESTIFTEARLYWSARHQMAQQPRVGVG